MNAPRVGYLEEAPGEYSMTRLIALLMAIGCLVLVMAAAIVAVRGGEHAGAIVGAIGVPMLGLAGGVWGSLKERE